MAGQLARREQDLQAADGTIQLQLDAQNQQVALYSQQIADLTDKLGAAKAELEFYNATSEPDMERQVSIRSPFTSPVGKMDRQASWAADTPGTTNHKLETELERYKAKYYRAKTSLLHQSVYATRWEVPLLPSNTHTARCGSS